MKLFYAKDGYGDLALWVESGNGGGPEPLANEFDTDSTVWTLLQEAVEARGFSIEVVDTEEDA